MARDRTTVIGFMTDWLDPGYQQVVLHGAIAAAQERNFKLIAYVTNSPFGTPLQVASTHQLVKPGCVDGLVIMAPSLSWGTPEDQECVLTPLHSIPKCLVASEDMESTSICVDNQSGLLLLIQHLIRDHQFRHLAFVRGPEFNAEAEQRLSCFRAALAEAGLPVNEKLILPGDFSPKSGATAVDLLLGERQVTMGSLDAIVAANDSMAMGVMEALAARGIQVPGQVAVTGFDDCADSRYLRAPLTTVRQPLFEQGKLAVRALTEHIRTGEPQRHVMRTELIVRHSCGCSWGSGKVLEVRQDAVRSGSSFDAAMLCSRQALLADLARVARGGLGKLRSGWEVRLVSALVEELKGRSADAFRREFEEIVQNISAGGSEPGAFGEIVSALWKHLIPCCMADPELRTRLEVCLDDARCTTAAAVQRLQGADLVNFRNRAFAFVSACSFISEAGTIEELARLLERYCSDLGITHLELALYPDGQQTEDALRVITFSGGRARQLCASVQAVELPNLILNEQGTLPGLLVTTLELQGEVLGLLVTNLEAGKGQLFQSIRAALGNAILVIRLRERLRQNAN